MTYATLMVHLTPGQSNAPLLAAAGALAERFRAAVIGVAACQPVPVVYSEAYISADTLEDDRKELERELKEAEVEFRTALQARITNLEWRSGISYAPLSSYLAHESRSADIVLTGVDHEGSLMSPSGHMNTGDFVMQAGRPVLVVPATADELTLEHVVIGWKDTRETRRATLDALPLLKKAAHVTVAEIATADDQAGAHTRVADVVAWLQRHGIAAESLISSSTGNDAAQLAAIASEHDADVIVAGAYGHSRLREWVLGGVTQNLLLRAERCALVSH